MKLFIRLLVIVLLLALDWVALHDIIQGEPDVWSEWVFVILSLIVFAIMFGDWYRDRR
jgi:hypothetical protein